MLRVMTLALLALLLAITPLSAYIRLARAGIACEPWPQCQARAQRAAEASGEVTTARVAHRVAAVSALLLIIGLLMSTLAAQPVLSGPGRLVLVLLGVSLFLAVLGRMTADSRAAGVVVGNLLGGFAMLAVAGGLWRQLPGSTDERAAIPAAWTWSTLVLLVLIVTLGAAASANAAAPADAGPAWWAVAHEYAGAALLLFLLARAAIVWRRGERLGPFVILILVLQWVASSLVAIRVLPLQAMLLHNFLAGLLMACAGALAIPRCSNAAATRHR